MKSIINLFLFFFLINSNTNNCYANQEKVLRQHLFQNYSKDMIPVANSNQPLNIETGIAIQNLEEFNQKVETIKLNIWWRMNWNDANLHWNSSQYGLGFLSVDSDQVWIPDLELFNAASLPEIYTLKGGIMLYSDGSLMWSRPGIFKFSCSLQLKQFPYDSQECTMTFGSWIYDNQKIHIQPYADSAKAIDILDEFSHSEWDVEGVKLSTGTITDDNGNLKDTITYTISLKRYSHYYNLSMGMTITLVFVSFIIMLVAPDNLSRTGTAVFIPLTILALQLTIADKVPVVGYYTLMDKFFLCCFVLSMFVSMESGLVYICLVTNSKQIFEFLEPYLLKKNSYQVNQIDDNSSNGNGINSDDNTEHEDEIEIDDNIIDENNETNSDIESIERTTSYENISLRQMNKRNNEINEIKENDIIGNNEDNINTFNDVYTTNIYRTIEHDNVYLTLNKKHLQVKAILQKYVRRVDNIFRFLCPFIYSIYIGSLIGSAQ